LARRLVVLGSGAALAAACASIVLAVAPGGNGLIAFTSNTGGNPDIAVLDPCGSERPLMTGPAADLKPVWSPDGRKLAFMSNRDGNFELYVANADGGNVHRLTNNPANDFNPAWSPDGRKLAWNSDRSGDFEIYVMNGDGSDVRRLTYCLESTPSLPGRRAATGSLSSRAVTATRRYT
jgi:Tol biopolymer transport system component